MQVQKHTLKNNLPVLFIETDTFPSFTALILIKAGSRYENVQNNGIAHFFEHMAFKGSRKYPDSLTIASTIEGLGGMFNAYTDKDHTGYWIKAPTEKFDVVLDVLSQMLLEPLLKAEEIEREKGVIFEEMNMYEDSPARQVGEVFQQLLYKGTPLGMDIICTKETVKNSTQKTFQDYMNAWYKPSNAVLTISGGFKKSPFAENYLQIIEEKFSPWKDHKISELPHIKDEQKKIGKKVKSKKTEQAHFCLGFRSFSLHDERRFAMSVMSVILGGGMSSRLFIQVRERRGLCYYISTGREYYDDVGYIVTQAGVTNNKEKVNEALQATLEQHTAMRNGDFTDEEIAKAKQLMRGRFIMSLEDSQAIAEYYGIRELFETSKLSPEEMLEKIDAVTRQEIIDVARYCFVPEKMNFAIIGPFKDKDFTIQYSPE
jgi:predicted Zn-dependent peptidase